MIGVGLAVIPYAASVPLLAVAATWEPFVAAVIVLNVLDPMNALPLPAVLGSWSLGIPFNVVLVFVLTLPAQLSAVSKFVPLAPSK